MIPLTFNIDAGKRYRINKISTKVNKALDKNLFLSLNDEFTKVIGKYYSPFIVKKLLDELDLIIDNNDLQFVEHNVNEIIGDAGIEIEINIFEGSKQLVERINIQVNTITEEGVIRAELLLDEGDPFNELKFEKSVAELKARDIFSEVKKRVSEGSNKDLKVVDIKVTEKSTGEISAGAGIGTTGGNFSFSISENNWLGQGKRLETFVDVNKTSFKGALSVSDPNYNNSGNALSYNITNTRNDKPDSGFENKIIGAGIGTKFEQYKNIYLTPTLNVTYDDLTVLGNASSSLKKQAGSYTDLSFGYSVQLDQREGAMPTDDL